MAATVPELSSSAPAARSRRTPALAGGMIALAALAAYGNSFHIPFLFDDAGSITNNRTIRSLWTALQPLPGGLPVSGRPVLNFSFALNYALSGLNVWSYHAVNLAIHILAGLTLFGIVRRTIPRWNGLFRLRPATAGEAPSRWFDGAEQRLGDKPLHLQIAFILALIWTVHPLQTESVDYISQRAESLMGLFYLLTLYFFIRGVSEVERLVPKPFVGLRPTEDLRQSPDPTAGRQAVPPWNLIFSIFFCLLGMGTKEVMVSAPLIVLLYDRTFVAGTFRESWRLRKKYYLGLASTWLVLIWLVLMTGARGGTAGFGLNVAPWDYALIQFQAIVHYLRLALWPHPLIFYYDRPMGVPAAVIGLDAAIMILLLGATMYGLFGAAARGEGRASAPLPRGNRGSGGQIRHSLANGGSVRPNLGDSGRIMGFLGASFFAILAPSSSVVPVATETIAEHRMYLPLAAVIAVVAGGICHLTGRFAGRRSARLCFLAGLVLAAGLGFMTARRNHAYRSDVALWAETVATTPDSSPARNNLGNALLQAGDAPAAISQCQEALRLNPRNARAHSVLADALLKMNRRPEAMSHYEEAVRLTPNDASIHNNLGIALAESDRLPEAIVHYETALRLDPGFTVAYNNLGNALVGLGRFSEAIGDFEQALRLQPDYAIADDNLGVALAGTGRLPEAARQYERALQLNPRWAEAENHLGNALAAMGKFAEAGGHYERALRFKPDFPEACNNLGNVLLETGQSAEAIGRYQEAVRLKPDYLAARCSLGGALADAGRTAEAAEQFAAASRLQPENAGFHNNLGCLLALLGRTGEARAQFEEALRLKPGDAEVRANLARLPARP